VSRTPVLCPDCYGTGQAHGRDLIYSCETCDGEGNYEPTDDERDDWIYEENLYLYGGGERT
jgi:hypothetical protein